MILRASRRLLLSGNNKLELISGGITMSATETTYKTSLINNRRYLGNKYKLQYKTKTIKINR